MAAALLLAASLVRRCRSVSLHNNSPCCVSSSHLFCKSPFSSSSYNYYYYYVQLLHFSTETPSANITPPALVFSEDYYVSKYQFSPQIASKLVSVSAGMKKPQNPDLFLSFLREIGFSSAHLERIVRHHPKVLSSCPEKSVKPKLKIFQDLGFSAPEVTHLIGRDFTILYRGADRIISSLDVYRRLLGSNDHVIKLIKKHGMLLYADPEKTVLPNIQFLNECGIPYEQINSCIYSYTNLFLQSPENMRRCVHKVDEMGVDRSSRIFIHAARAVCAMSDETLKFKLESFQDLGFSEEDILRVFRTAPLVISLSTRKRKEVIEVLLETGKYDMSCIINNPTSLTRSAEKRYKPRLQVLKELERKGLIDKWPALSTLACMTDKSFFEKFVAPNINQVGEEFIAKTSLAGKLETTTGLKLR